MNGKILAPSILGHNSCRIVDGIAIAEKFHAPWVHVDVMDGMFVQNIAGGQCVVRDMCALTRLTLDVHLMVQSPERLVESFADAGADALTVHAEATEDPVKISKLIERRGCMAGIAINPDTPVAAIEKIIDWFDIILLMGVHPGKCGQKFLVPVYEKIRALLALREVRRLSYKISVDGGINAETLPLANDAGADIFVSGSSFFTNPEGISKIFRSVGN
ncbi:MAG: ribulose-phosphate 3-epimerase [Puniceicoccales bacterium]|jgi:ribulose-phosphate 3-epimerase|nr:ribulose-phosphate 3-epimerase [Puniceicoccales bacterium]